MIRFLILSFILHLTYFTHGQNAHPDLKIGWAIADITPDKPVLVSGQFHARISEGVLDPILATVLAMESGENAQTSEKAIFISCDLVGISDGTRDDAETNLVSTVRKMITSQIPGMSEKDIVLNATHTHSAPYCGTEKDISKRYGVDLDAMSPYEYLEFMADKVAEAAVKAWENRKVGGISYGLSHAVVGHNRLQAQNTGTSIMYGNTNQKDFSHIEGFEDHSVNLLYTWDVNQKLTGIIMNVASPSQVSEHEYNLSADYWHDVREEIHHQIGDDIFVLPQCSAAGDQSPHFMYDSKAEERMQKLMFPDVSPGRGSLARRKQIAKDLAAATISILPYMKESIEYHPVFEHKKEVLNLTRRLLNNEDVHTAKEEAANWHIKYKEHLQKIEENPNVKNEKRWYRDVTYAYSRYNWYAGVEERFKLEKTHATIPIEVHVVRIGDVAIATNPFELYVDYGTRIKAQSPAVQTFLVQLSGSGSYVPTARSIKGGAYGAVASSTLIGPEGGQELVEGTLKIVNSLWKE